MRSTTGPAALVGNSFGCQVVAECAVRHPELVRAIVLAGPAVDPAGTAVRQVGRWLTNAVREPVSLIAVVARDTI